MDSIADLLGLQVGVVSRRQALERGLAEHDLRRLVRRRELAIVHPGVLVAHTGPLTWSQRAWAATLAIQPAALSHISALRAVGGPGRRDHDEDGPIHVATDRQRRAVAPSGVVVHRMAGFEDHAVWHASPPRVRVEEALIDLASDTASDWQAVERLAGAVQARLTTATRLRTALDGRERIARRRFLTGILDDIAAGTCSVLEHGYLVRVERAHGLPRAGRQVPEAGTTPVYRDVDYQPYGLIVELDGRLFHDSTAARDRDLDRDHAAVTGRQTIRLGWGQVFERPCLTAERIASLLRARGWAGVPTSCPQCGTRSLPSPADRDPPHCVETTRGVSQRVAHPSSSPPHRRPLGSRQRQPMEVIQLWAPSFSGVVGQDSTGTRSFWPA